MALGDRSLTVPRCRIHYRILGILHLTLQHPLCIWPITKLATNIYQNCCKLCSEKEKSCCTTTKSRQKMGNFKKSLIGLGGLYLERKIWRRAMVNGLIRSFERRMVGEGRGGGGVVGMVRIVRFLITLIARPDPLSILTHNAHLVRSRLAV